ncbi:MAG: MFS transporter [Candidatus Fimenecus sp.]
MKKAADLRAFVKDKWGDLKTHWRTPPSKKYVPYREIAAYSVGGAGVYFIISVVGMIGMNVGSMIVGASIGIAALDLQTMNVVATLIGLITAPMRAMLFDNTRSKMGKFRPYLLTMGLPTAFFGTLLVFLPYENMEYTEKAVCLFLVYTVLQFFSPFYTTAYAGLVQVMSPNSSERAWIIEISSVIYSFAPTVVNPVLPLIGPLDDLRTYRIAFPIFCILGLFVSMFCVFGTQERIIVPKRYVPKVGFVEGLKKVAHNKYFWIINGSSWLSFLAGGYGYIFQWVFYYGMNNAALYALMVVIRGEAATPGMLLGAPLANKLGKKKICLISLSVQTLCLVLMLACYKNYILVFLMIFFKDMFSALSIIYLPAMKADMMDYQQYKTGDRLEGFMDQIGQMSGNLIGLATGYAIPLILRYYGLTDNYDQLFDADFRNPLVYAIIISSVIGTLLSLFPFLFYDLSEQKRANMIKVLKIRALFADYSHQELSDDALIDTVEAIHEAQAILAKPVAANDKAAQLQYEAAQITVRELQKFESAEYQEKVQKAEQIVEDSVTALCQFDKATLYAAKKMPKKTKEQRVARREAIAEAKQRKRSALLIPKYFPEGIEIPDASCVAEALALPDTTAAQKRVKKQAVRAAERKMKLFEAAAKPYTDAVRLLGQRDAYAAWAEIEAKYAAVKSV